MNQYRFHVASLPHIPCTKSETCCAFTAKCYKFCEMMLSLGHKVYHYGLEGSDPPCTKNIITHTMKERVEWMGEYDSAALPNLKWDEKELIWKVPNLRAAAAIAQNKKTGDFLCIISGCQHDIADIFPDMPDVEFGIGYYGVKSRYRVYESYTHMACCVGQQHTQDSMNNYHVVIPNYFDVNDFPYQPEKKNYVLHIGRMTVLKGVYDSVQATKEAGMNLILAGQGGKSDGKSLEFENGNIKIIEPHVSYVGNVGVEVRAKLMGEALAVMVPSRYHEPFGGVCAEAQLCFPAETKVIAHGIQKAFSSEFTGVLYTIRSGSDIIQCTPSHPFLTQRGWVAAKDLTMTDHLIQSRDGWQGVEQRRIGDIVAGLSEQGDTWSGSCDRASIRGRESHVAKDRDKTDWTPSVYGSRDEDYAGILSQSRRSICRKEDQSYNSSYPQEGRIYGPRVRSSGETILGFGNSNNKEELQIFRSGISRERSRQEREFNFCKSKEDWIVSRHFGEGEIQSGHNVENGSGISRRINRWGGNGYSQENVGQEKSIAVGMRIEYGRRNDRMDKRENSNKERHNKQNGGEGIGLFSWMPSRPYDHFRPRIELFTALPYIASIPDRQETPDANADRMVRNSSGPITRRQIYGENARTGGNDSIYEFTRIRSISHREVEKLPVFNLATSTGIYEAEGFVVHNCGTPVITTDWASFSETVKHGKTGYRCRTLRHFVEALKVVHNLDTQYIRDRAVSLWSMDRIKWMYQEYFDMLTDLHHPTDKKGWGKLDGVSGNLNWLSPAVKGYPYPVFMPHEKLPDPMDADPETLATEPHLPHVPDPAHVKAISGWGRDV